MSTQWRKMSTAKSTLVLVYEFSISDAAVLNRSLLNFAPESQVKTFYQKNHFSTLRTKSSLIGGETRTGHQIGARAQSAHYECLDDDQRFQDPAGRIGDIWRPAPNSGRLNPNLRFPRLKIFSD